jgi:hypothetical protein
MLAPLMSRCIMCGCKYSWRWMRPWAIPTHMLNRIVQSKNKTCFICRSANTKMLTIINHKVLRLSHMHDMQTIKISSRFLWHGNLPWP